MAVTIPALNPNTSHQGTFNNYRTSNIQLVYTPATLPEPWPYLLSSFLLSLGTNVWGLVFASRGGGGKSWIGRLRANIFVLINLFRATLALVVVFKVVSRHGGRWPTPTSLTVLFLTCATNYWNQDDLFEFFTICFRLLEGGYKKLQTTNIWPVDRGRRKLSCVGFNAQWVGYSVPRLLGTKFHRMAKQFLWGHLRQPPRR